MKIVIASDSFKGSLLSAEANAAIAAGLSGAIPDAEILQVTVGDGGEGTCRSLVEALHGVRYFCMVEGPLGDTVKAHYGIVNGDTAIIEMSEASGLTLIDAGRRNPMLASTFGTGEMIKNALEKGCRTVVVGIGGSATTDGGMGMLAALGVRFFDAYGNLLKPCGASLNKIARIDMHELSAYRDVRFIVAADVDNPLYGSSGAACVFAPQKGAAPEQVKALDRGLGNYARVSERILGKDYSSLPGAGAAGGLGFAFAAYLHGKLCSGADIVLDAWKFDEKIRNADIVITGEGRLDRQTIMGKIPFRILERARRVDVPVFAIGGSVCDREILVQAGFAALVPVEACGASLEDAMCPETAFANIKKTVADIADIIIAFAADK